MINGCQGWQAWRLARMAQVPVGPLKGTGWSRWDVARALDVSERSVSYWDTQVRMGGPRALLSVARPGRPPVLSPEQRQKVPELLWHGAEAYGFRGSLWTCHRVAKVI